MAEQRTKRASRQVSEEWFRYDWAHTAIFHILSLVGALVASLVLVDLVINIFAFAATGESDITHLASLLGYFLLLALYSLAISSAYPNFRISNTGLIVQVFVFWWVFIPWRDVQEIRSSLWGTSKLVFVRRLTLIHRIYGWIFGLTPRPAFVITRRIQDHDKAVKTIQRNRGGA